MTPRQSAATRAADAVVRERRRAQYEHVVDGYIVLCVADPVAFPLDRVGRVAAAICRELWGIRAAGRPRRFYYQELPS